MRITHRLFAAAILAILAPACASEPSAPKASLDGPVGRMIAGAAKGSDVPAELMVAIAHIEGGLLLAEVREVDDDDAIPIAGVLELRHGRFNSLARGAELLGRTERELSLDTALGTEAGARVLDDLAQRQGIARADIGAWASVVDELSGHLHERDREDYRARVFKVLRYGGRIKARGGEVITLPPREDVPISLTLSPPRLQALDVPEHEGAEWFQTPQNGKWTPGREAPISMIAIHDTEGGWEASVATLQNDPGKSVHYIVDKDGSRVGQFIHEKDTGWHVGNWYYNSRMVGIEHVGYSGVDDYETSMYERSALLVKDIAARNGLTVDRATLIAHQEVPNGSKIDASSPPCSDSPGSCIKNTSYGGANHHTDPGIYWEWCQYMELAGGTCKCNDAYELWNCVHDLSMMVRCPEGKVEIVHCADECVVEPIGTNDHCTPVSPGDTGAGGGGAGAGSSSSSAGVGGGGEGGSAAPGSGGGGGGPNGGTKDPGEDSSCSVSGAGLGGSSLGLAAIAMAGAAIARRRRQSGG
jgi:N-acetyl-anhydromuramyl-L-alanine amidase AmpD